MVKKPKKSAEIGEEKTSFLEGVVPKMVLDILKGFVGNIANSVQDAIYYTQKKILQTLFSSALFIMGIIFISIALVLLISEYLTLSKGWSFLILGLVLIIWGLLLKYHVHRTKYA